MGIYLLTIGALFCSFYACLGQTAVTETSGASPGGIPVESNDCAQLPYESVGDNLVIHLLPEGKCQMLVSLFARVIQVPLDPRLTGGRPALQSRTLYTMKADFFSNLPRYTEPANETASSTENPQCPPYPIEANGNTIIVETSRQRCYVFITHREELVPAVNTPFPGGRPVFAVRPSQTLQVRHVDVQQLQEQQNVQRQRELMQAQLTVQNAQRELQQAQTPLQAQQAQLRLQRAIQILQTIQLAQQQMLQQAQLQAQQTQLQAQQAQQQGQQTLQQGQQTQLQGQQTQLPGQSEQPLVPGIPTPHPQLPQLQQFQQMMQQTPADAQAQAQAAQSQAQAAMAEAAQAQTAMAEAAMAQAAMAQAAQAQGTQIHTHAHTAHAQTPAQTANTQASAQQETKP